jgi:hypothetical protein
MAIGQTDSLMYGEYKAVEEIGIDIEVVSTGNGQSMLSKTYVDTTITRTIKLDSLHCANLEIDTLIGIWSPNSIIHMSGSWSIEGDILIIRFTKVATEYRVGSTQEIPIEYTNLNAEIIVYYKIEFIKGKSVYALIPRNEQREWLKYRKT